MARLACLALALLALAAPLALGAASATSHELPPPAHYLHAPHPACDVDGDGLSDLLVERLELLQPPRLAPAVARVFMRSSADGSLLWEAGAGDRGDLTIGPGLSFDRPSEEHRPRAGVFATDDLDGDGVCDVLLATNDALTVLSEPFFGTASVTTFTLEVRALSGATGEPLWRATQEGTRARAQEGLFNTAVAEQYLGVPTGAMLAAGASGPVLYTKTTDVTYLQARDPFDLTGAVVGQPLFSQDVRVVDHIRAWDARTGEVLWDREVQETEGDQWTRLSYFVEAHDLNGDGVDDPVLERLLLANPRGNELQDPVFGENLYRYGKGHGLEAFDGTTGAQLWDNLVVDPDAVRPNPPVEEGFETILWTHAQGVGDVDGDGVTDIAARTLVSEERLGNTLLGGFRTHLLPVSGATGEVLWDTRVQGWGGATPIGADDEGAKLAITSVDVSLDAADRGTRPSQHVHIQVVEAATGATVWGHDHPVSRLGNVPARLALDQLLEAAAPFDLDGDGLLDVVTPAQAAGRAAHAQGLASLQSARYEVLAGEDGDTLAVVEAWGGLGRSLACEDAAAGMLTVLGGHSRRFDLMRFDLQVGTTAFRVPVFNDPGLRAASAAMDLSGVLASCRVLEDGTLLVTTNAHRYSHERRGEVNPVLARLTPAGDVLWMDPAVAGNAPVQPLVAPRVVTTSTDTLVDQAVRYGLLVAAGLVAGLVLYPLLTRLLRRRERVPSLAVVAVAASMLAVLAPVPTPTADALAPAPLGHTLTDDAPLGGGPQASGDERGERPVVPVSISPLSPPPQPRSGDNLTPDEAMAGEGVVVYSHPVRDIDGDGHGDVVIVASCVDWRICDPYTGLESDVQWLQGLATEGAWCGIKQRLWGVSTATGEIVWEMDTQLRRQVFGTVSCRLHVVDVLDLGDGRDGVLLYERTERYADLGISSRIIENTVSVVDAATGELVWTTEEPGAYGNGLAAWRFARNWDLRFHVVPGAPGEGDALFVRGTGYEMHVAQAFGVQFLGLRREPTVTDVWEPVEWIARLDPATGTELWRNEAFLPGGGRSVYVWGHAIEPGSYYWSTWNTPVPPMLDAVHWLPECCGDLTGDGVPDPVMHTREWPLYPEANPDGPYFLDASLHVFDGATGERLYAIAVAEDVDAGVVPARAFDRGEAIYATRIQAAGDADGDGAGDLLVQEERRGNGYERIATLRSGPTGEALWQRASPQDLALVPIGDVNGDGGTDLLALAWHGPVAGDDVAPSAARPQGHTLEVVSGRTGSLVKQVPAWGAAVDLLVQFDWLERLGVPDLDGDGVGDLLVDDPFALDDQATVHRLAATSTRDGRVLWEATAVGAFAITGNAGDLDGDGRDEVLLLSGDQEDLWLTLHDGATGTAHWSRPALSIGARGLARALPRLHVAALEAPAGEVANLFLELQLSADVLSTYLSLRWDTSSNAYTFGYVEEPEPIVVNNVAIANAATGWTAMRYGSGLDGPGGERGVAGPAPATQAFEGLLDEASRPLALQSLDAARSSAPSIGAVLVGLLAGLAAAAGIARLGRRDKGVPDLDL